MMRPLRNGVRASEGLRASVRDPAALRSPLPVDTPPEVRVYGALNRTQRSPLTDIFGRQR